jgi:hypothetical protein
MRGRIMINEFNMFKLITISALLLTMVFVQAQKMEPMVAVTKDAAAQKFGIYQIVIKNRSDSILCILHSLTLTLTESQPQVLAMPDKNPDNDDFSLQYSADDTGRAYEVEPYLGEVVLPGQSLVFKVQPLFSDPQKPARLSFEYIYLNDFCYGRFLDEMKKVGSWYKKYSRSEAVVKIPTR